METFRVDNFDPVFSVFLALFSAAFGIFYYLVLTGIYERKIRPGWLLFAVPPCIVLLTAVFDMGYVPLAALFHFPVITLLMVCGPIYTNLIKKEGLVWQLMAFYILGPLVLLTGFWGFAVVFVTVIFYTFIKPGKKSNFYELQRVLPTSKIRSMAMGLVEVTGKTQMLEPVTARIKKEPCIGYLYKIDSIKRGDKGKKSYTNISTETVCNSFLVRDDSGTVRVSGKDISLIDLPESPHSYESNSKRYQLFVLREAMSVLVIGKATNQKQKIHIEKDDGKKVFAISPLDRVQRWNRYRPLRLSLLRHVIVLVILVIGILICDFQIENDKIFVSLSTLYEPIGFFEDIKHFYKTLLE